MNENARILRWMGRISRLSLNRGMRCAYVKLSATEMTEEPGLVARAALALTDWAERWIPDAFIFALLATFIVFLAASLATPSPPTEIVDAWGRGFWELIPFTLQMSLIIITGHVLATSPPIGRLIRAIASQ